MMKNQTEAFAQVKKALTEGEGKVINDLSEVGAIGHRVVQGGDRFDRSVIVTEKVKITVKVYIIFGFEIKNLNRVTVCKGMKLFISNVFPVKIGLFAFFIKNGSASCVRARPI